MKAKQLKISAARAKKKLLKNFYRTADHIFDGDLYWKYTMKINGYHSPEYRFRKDQIAVLHVPKTGGTSFNKMLLKGEDADVFVNLKIHRPVSKYCPPSQYKYVTILRNPVDRVWSQYQMVLREREGYPYKKYAVRGLNCFLKNCWVVQDMTCRYYSGSIDQDPNADTLRIAEANLQQFYSILSFDNFSNEVVSFFKRENIAFQSIIHERKAAYRKPTNEEVHLISGFNQYDLELYHNWKKLIKP